MLPLLVLLLLLLLLLELKLLKLELLLLPLLLLLVLLSMLLLLLPTYGVGGINGLLLDIQSRFLLAPDSEATANAEAGTGWRHIYAVRATQNTRRHSGDPRKAARQTCNSSSL